jgi:hypothetical protein
MCVTDHFQVLRLPTDISPELLKILAERDDEGNNCNEK